MVLSQLLAQVNLGTFKGIGPLGEPTDIDWATGKFENAISITIAVMTIVAGIWFIYQFFIGAFEWLSAAGEKTQIQNAHKKLINGMVGLGVIVLSYALISIFGRMVGFSDILNPGALIKTLTP